MKIFIKCYAPNWSEDFVNNKKVKNTVPRTLVIDNLNWEERFGTFHEKELQRKPNKLNRFKSWNSNKEKRR